MSFLWGFLMFFICHTLCNTFLLNIYCFRQEENSTERNKYAQKRYLISACISFIIYIALLCISLNVLPFCDNKSAILIGNGIGFMTGSIHYHLIAKDNYLKQKAKNEWKTFDYMSEEEKLQFMQNKFSHKQQNSSFDDIDEPDEETDTDEFHYEDDEIDEEDIENFNDEDEEEITEDIHIKKGKRLSDEDKRKLDAIFDGKFDEVDDDINMESDSHEEQFWKKLDEALSSGWEYFGWYHWLSDLRIRFDDIVKKYIANKTTDLLIDPRNGKRIKNFLDCDSGKLLYYWCKIKPYISFTGNFNDVFSIHAEKLDKNYAIVYSFRVPSGSIAKIVFIFLVKTEKNKLRLFTIETSFPFALCEYCGTRHILHSEINSLADVPAEIITVLGQEKSAKNTSVFKDYSIKGWLEYAKEYPQIGYVFCKESLDLVLELEEISFRELIENIDKIKDKYMLFSYDHKEHSMSEISEKYWLYDFFHYFYDGLGTGYLGSVRIKRISFEKFYNFLKSEVKTQKIYKSNVSSVKELNWSLVDDMGFPIFDDRKVIYTELTEQNYNEIFSLVKTFLEKENLSLFWLSQHCTSSGLGMDEEELYEEKYSLQELSLSNAVQWFWFYCDYEEKQI